jgi:O-antigen ligase
MLTSVAPLIAYLLAFPVMVITLFRVEVGILYFITAAPILALMRKFAQYPLGNNIMDFVLLSMIFGWIFAARREGRSPFTRSPLNVVVMLTVVWYVVNLLIGYTVPEFSEFIHETRLKTWKNYMILPIIYFIAVSCINRNSFVKWIIVSLCLSMIAMDFNFYSTFRWFRAENYSDNLRISGTFTFLGPNEMGVFFAMYTFLLLGISYYIEDWRLKAAVILVCACNFYPILFSYSRAAYLCAAAGFLLLGLLKDRRVLVLLLILIVSYRIVLPNSVVERIDMTFLDKEEISEEQRERSEVDVGGVALDTTGRKELWASAKEYFLQYPGLGMGFDTFRHRQGMITHSLYMRVLAEQGIIGVIVLFGFSLCLIMECWRLYRSSENPLGRGVGLGFFLCMNVHLVGSVTGDQSLYYNFMAIYWLFMGVVGNLNSRNREIRASSEEGTINSFEGMEVLEAKLARF